MLLTLGWETTPPGWFHRRRDSSYWQHHEKDCSGLRAHRDAGWGPSLEKQQEDGEGRLSREALLLIFLKSFQALSGAVTQQHWCGFLLVSGPAS